MEKILKFLDLLLTVENGFFYSVIRSQVHEQVVFISFEEEKSSNLYCKQAYPIRICCAEKFAKFIKTHV